MDRPTDHLAQHKQHTPLKFPPFLLRSRDPTPPPTDSTAPAALSRAGRGYSRKEATSVSTGSRSIWTGKDGELTLFSRSRDEAWMSASLHTHAAAAAGVVVTKQSVRHT